MTKALIAMSGGVDSSVTGLLMKDQGYDCIGATMKLFSNEDIGCSREKTCCSLSDVEDARAVAFKIGIPHQVFNFSDNFKHQVMDRFTNTYLLGETPNPCIDCNRYLKYEKFLHRACELGIDCIATGHYAKIEYDASLERYILKKAADQTKDQSYVLYTMTQEQLSRTVFPLGGYTKTQVREIAARNGLVNAKKRESQDICFIPDGDFAAFIENQIGKGSCAGNFILSDGTFLGKHGGYYRYTVGQRRGLGIPHEKPLYVLSIDIQSGNVVLGEEEDLYTKTLTARNINLISCTSIDYPKKLKAKIRYRQEEQWATVTQTSSDSLFLEFDLPQRAITKGQSVVLYDGDIVVGGGIIM